MVKASARLKDGRHLIVIGLSAENIRRLQNGDPIYFDVQTLKIPADQTVGHVTIFAGETETELTRTLKSLIGPVTEVVTVPKGDPRPT